MIKEFGAGLDLLAGAQGVDAPALAIGCEFDELARVGHFPEVEAPAEFRAAVTAFLAGRPVAGVA
ncbi:MAG TPA: hypothetical protein VGM53_19300 [Streptosporangiaceae bacterium]